MEWIKCSDKMPKYGELILAYCEDGLVTSLRLNKKNKYWNTDKWENGEELFRLNYVTHWMPLPDKPKD